MTSPAGLTAEPGLPMQANGCEEGREFLPANRAVGVLVA